MKNRELPKPTEAELEILQLLWAHGSSSVRFINEKLNAQRSVGYTTTLKTLQIMFEKKLVSRDDSSRTHIYKPAVGEADIQKKLLNQFVDSAFRGSAMNLVMQALGNHKATKAEIGQIKALLRQLDEEE